ncbi:MAG: SBBP repeat-containing protein, partial [Taibaiella sp.]|nr:SBBP repeat-containing protein [Taibaiella sp.]
MKLKVGYILFLLLPASISAKDNNHIQILENKGQITDQHGAMRKDIDVKLEANGVTMFVGDGEIHYQWSRPSFAEATAGEESRESGASGHPPSPFGDTPFKGGILSGASEPTPTPPKRGGYNGSSLLGEIEGQNSRRTKSEVEIYRMDVKLVGANKNAEVIFEEPTGYYENYYLAHTGENGASARGFQRVIYKDIYPNIDLLLYTESKSKPKSQNPKENNLQSNIEYQTSNIKYDFIVHPGGNPADIQLRYEGATEVKLVDGVLVATTPFGTITEDVPYSYCKETKQQVNSTYKLSGNTLSFEVGNYTGTLVIDPVLKWATYYGGSGEDNLQAVATDRCGNVYIGGSSSSTANIATSGAHQANYSGSSGNGFIAKLNMHGIRQWASYYAENTIINDLACDGDNNVYATGMTRDTNNVATTGAHQAQHGGGPVGHAKNDAFLVKFNTNGQRLWGTYYGGNNADGGAALAIDAKGYIYMGGQANSPSGI